MGLQRGICQLEIFDQIWPGEDRHNYMKIYLTYGWTFLAVLLGQDAVTLRRTLIYSRKTDNLIILRRDSGGRRSDREYFCRT